MPHIAIFNIGNVPVLATALLKKYIPNKIIK